MKRAIISNVTGSIIGFIFSLIAIPIQIRLLGSEAYGLIGFIASLQIILVVFDFGLSSSVVREIAASADDDVSKGIVQTGATIYWIVASIVGCLVFVGADWIAQDWLHVKTLTPEYIASAVRVIAIYMILNWPVGHYANVLFALKRLDLVNGLRVAVTVVSQLGGIVVILLTYDLIAFLMWLTFSSFVSVVLHLLFIKRVFPAVTLTPRISLAVIRRIWRTSFDMNIVSTASIIYTQLDKLLISNLLPLSVLGYYSIAYRLMVGATLIPVSIASITLPLFAEKFSRGQHTELVHTYNRISQLILYIITGFTFAFVFWGYDLLKIWTTAETAANTYQTLGILTVGALLNTVTVVGYYLVLATGRSRLLSFIYSAGVIPYVICLYFLIIYLQIIGVAIALILYSLYLIGTLLFYIQWKITNESVIRWLNRNFTAFVIIGFIIFGTGRFLIESSHASSVVIVWGIGVLSGIAYFGLGLFLLEATSRKEIFAFFNTTLRTILKRGN